jgi:hypothetical protein
MPRTRRWPVVPGRWPPVARSTFPLGGPSQPAGVVAGLATQLRCTSADRLKPQGLEQLRGYFDRNDIGLILIGMPGFERQSARDPQLDSRIGFAHQYRPPDPAEVPRTRRSHHCAGCTSRL